jgi:hypothetical protein
MARPWLRPQRWVSTYSPERNGRGPADTRPCILDHVAKRTLPYPVTHGARVQLPEESDLDLFPLKL